MRHSKRSYFVSGLLAAVAGLSSATAVAQPVAASPPEPKPTPIEAKPDPATPSERRVDGADRILGKHLFAYPAFVDTSFVTSYVGLRARLGLFHVTNVPTDAGPLDIDAASLDEGLDVGIKLTKFLGLFATAGARSLIGTNLKSFTYAGATYELGAGGGAIVRLYHNDETGTQLSLRGEASYASGRVSTLLPLFENPAQSFRDAAAGDLGESIRTPVRVIGYGGSITFAQAFSRMFGLQASASLGGSSVRLEPYDRLAHVRNSVSVSEVTYGVGIAPSVDFSPLRVPITLMPEYAVYRRSASSDLRASTRFDTQHVLAVGVYYSGRPALQIGVVASTVFDIAPVETVNGASAAPSKHTGQLILRYVW